MSLLPPKATPLILGEDGSYVGLFGDNEPVHAWVIPLPPALLSDPLRASRARQRFDEIAQVETPHSARALDLVDGDGRLWWVESYSPSVGVDELIGFCSSREMPLPQPIFLNLAIQLSTALHDFHRAGRGQTLHHGAICPSNVRLTSEGLLFLSRPSLSTHPQLSDTPLPASALRHLAPEQIDLSAGVSAQADLFSMGTVLFEMMFLRPLFPRGERDPSAYQAIRELEMDGLPEILERLLQPDPDARYPGAHVVREELRALMAGHSFTDVDAVTAAFVAPLRDERARTVSPPSDAGQRPKPPPTVAAESDAPTQVPSLPRTPADPFRFRDAPVEDRRQGPTRGRSSVDIIGAALVFVVALIGLMIIATFAPR